MTNKKCNKEFLKMVAELYRPGQSVKQLSSEYGVSKLTVCKWIKTYSSITSVDKIVNDFVYVIQFFPIRI